MYQFLLANKISTDNTRNGESLATGGTYSGSFEDIGDYSSIVASIHSTRAVTLYIDFSMNGIDIHRTISYDVSANTGQPHTLARIMRYMKVRVANSSGSSAILYLQMFLSAAPKSHLTTNISSNVSSYSDAEVVRAVLVGQTDGGQYKNSPVTSEGHQEVAIHDPRLPFSAIHTEILRPIVQVDGVYGASAVDIVSSVSGSGTANGSNGLLQVSTGVTVNSTAYHQTRRRIRYRPGQGTVARFTAMFTTGVANSYQVAGLGHSEDGYYFGYKGAQFGIIHNFRGVREVQTLTLSAASSTTENVTVTLDSVAFSIAVTNSANINRTAYEISQGTYSGWKAEAVGSTIIFIADSVGNKSGTFTLSGSTAAGTFAETKAGSAASETFIAQTAWNADPMDGTGASGVTLDPTKLNVYQIGVAYLGAGAISFAIMTSPTGNNATFVTVHVLNFPNTLTLPSVGNPSFPLLLAAYSAGSTTNLTVSSGSMAGFVEGERYFTGPRFSYLNSSTAVTDAAYRALFTVRNSRYFKGRSNQVVMNLVSMAAAIKHTSPVIVYIFRDATLIGNPVFAAYDTQSAAYVDTAATTCTITNNRQLIWSGPMGDTGNILFPFSDEEAITIQPGESITIAAKAVTGSPSWVTASINIREDQ